MLCGFSLVSLAELMFFLGWLTLKLMFKRKMEKKQTPAYILNGGKVPIWERWQDWFESDSLLQQFFVYWEPLQIVLTAIFEQNM